MPAAVSAVVPTRNVRRVSLIIDHLPSPEFTERHIPRLRFCQYFECARRYASRKVTAPHFHHRRWLIRSRDQGFGLVAMVAILIFDNCIRCLSRFPLVSLKLLRATIVALAATIAIAAWLTPALAGIVSTDDSSNPLKAAEAYNTYLTEHAPGMVEPIVDYSEIAGQPAKCDRAVKPKVHAILIGTADAGPPFNKLVGPDNDVDLMGASLSSRGVADDDIFVLVGDDSSREMVGNAFLETLEAVNCGDHVLLYFSGNASRSLDLLNAVLPQGLLDQYANVSISDIWSADLYAPEDWPTAAIRWAERAGLYLALDQQQDGVLDVLSAPDISDFVTNLRNRQVDVTVALDTSYASDADLAGRQAQVGDTTMWSDRDERRRRGRRGTGIRAAYAAAAQSRRLCSLLCQRRQLACARARLRRCGRREDHLWRIHLPPRQRHPEPRQRHSSRTCREPEDAADRRGFRGAALPRRGHRPRTGDVHRPFARRTAD